VIKANLTRSLVCANSDVLYLSDLSLIEKRPVETELMILRAPAELKKRLPKKPHANRSLIPFDALRDVKRQSLEIAN
jgi:hypothetical protein